MTYIFDGRYALLTYAQCGDLDPWRVSNRLTELGAECIVARENHVDGGSHLHVFVDFGRRFRSRSAAVFDVGHYHPNIEPTYHDPKSGYDYAVKEGEIVAGGLEPPDEATRVERGKHFDWDQAVEATNRDDFFALLARGAPKNLILNFPAIQKFADWKFNPKPVEYVSPEGTFSLAEYPELQGWVERELEVSPGGK